MKPEANELLSLSCQIELFVATSTIKLKQCNGLLFAKLIEQHLVNNTFMLNH